MTDKKVVAGDELITGAYVNPIVSEHAEATKNNNCGVTNVSNHLHSNKSFALDDAETLTALGHKWRTAQKISEILLMDIFFVERSLNRLISQGYVEQDGEAYRQRPQP